MVNRLAECPGNPGGSSFSRGVLVEVGRKKLQSSLQVRDVSHKGKGRVWDGRQRITDGREDVFFRTLKICEDGSPPF